LKTLRQMKILEIIRTDRVRTQEDLATRLRRAGLSVTQATVSRDIKELKLVKVPSADGDSHYSQPQETGGISQWERMRRYLRDSVVSLDYSENLVVVKTLSGTAMAVGAALDSLPWPEIVGLVAGDDAVLVVIKPKDSVGDVLRRLRDMAG
jgi:transcriptional regulator of arginine metabolism